MAQFTGDIISTHSTLVCVQKLSLVKVTCKALLRLTNAITEHISRTYTLQEHCRLLATLLAITYYYCSVH